MSVEGSWCRASGLGFGKEFEVWGLRFRVESFGFRLEDVEGSFRVHRVSSGFRVQGSGG